MRGPRGRRGSGAAAAKADAVIFIWLPGGISQNETWDPKRYTPFEPGMKGNHLLAPSRHSHLGRWVAVWGRAGAFGRSNASRHARPQPDQRYQVRRGPPQGPVLHAHRLPVSGGVKAPSLAAAVARTLGRRDQHVPPYIYIGRDIDTSDTEKQFIHESIGPGFYGLAHAPFMIPDPTAGLATLHAAAGIDTRRLDERIRVFGETSRSCRPKIPPQRPGHPAT